VEADLEGVGVGGETIMVALRAREAIIGSGAMEVVEGLGDGERWG
jgi:hypothetical protein